MNKKSKISELEKKLEDLFASKTDEELAITEEYNSLGDGVTNKERRELLNKLRELGLKKCGKLILEIKDLKK